MIELFLSNNRLSKVPDTVSEMNNLERLYLSDNLLTELPVQLDDLVGQDIVLLDGNPLRQ